MTRTIQCKKASKIERKKVKVKIARAPWADERILRKIISQRAQAVVI